MDKKLVIKIVIGAAAAIAIFIIVRRAFAPEKILLKKYGKFFDPSYIVEAVKKVYAQEIEDWTAKGAKQDEIIFYIIRQLYPDRERLKNGAEIIANAKGTFSDDEEKALGVFALLKDMPELSYMCLIWQRESEAGKKIVSEMQGGWLISGNPFFSEDNIEYTPLLPYLGTYFNRKHWSALLSILDKKPRKMKKEAITPPSAIDKSTMVIKPPKGFGEGGGKVSKGTGKKKTTAPKKKK